MQLPSLKQAYKKKTIKKQLITFVFIILFCISSVYSKDRVYEYVDQNTIQVTVLFDNGKIEQIGTAVNKNGKWVNDGEWTMYDDNGNVQLKSLWDNGKMIWVSRKYNQYLVTYKIDNK